MLCGACICPEAGWAWPHHQPSSVRGCVVLHSSGPKGKWSSPSSAHSYSFHPTVLLEKALSAASEPAVLGSGVTADLLRGHGAPVQSVIKHTAHLADLAPLPGSPPSHGPPRLLKIKHRAPLPLALRYQPGCLITSTRRAKQ